MATTGVALALGMPAILWLLIGLGLASINGITFFVLAKSDAIDAEW